MASKQAKRLTLDEIDRIVELRLNRITYRQIAQEVGCDKDTVADHWHKWLDRTSEERREHLERKRSEVIERLDMTAANARRAALRIRSELVKDPAEAAKAEARFLAEERQALVALSKVAGYDAPTRISTTFVPEMSEEEAARILAELDGVE